MIVNYRAKSADGLSITFLAVWMLGDATNLIGPYEIVLASSQFLQEQKKIPLLLDTPAERRHMRGSANPRISRRTLDKPGANSSGIGHVLLRR